MRVIQIEVGKITTKIAKISLQTHNTKRHKTTGFGSIILHKAPNSKRKA
jgi:hypothetical protein